MLHSWINIGSDWVALGWCLLMHFSFSSPTWHTFSDLEICGERKHVNNNQHKSKGIRTTGSDESLYSQTGFHILQAYPVYLSHSLMADLPYSGKQNFVLKQIVNFLFTQRQYNASPLPIFIALPQVSVVILTQLWVLHDLKLTWGDKGQGNKIFQASWQTDKCHMGWI